MAASCCPKTIIKGFASGTQLEAELSRPTTQAAPDPEVQKLFDRFYRVEASRSHAFGGSGLGLSVCKAIIEAHGGTIIVGHSDLGGLSRSALSISQQAITTTGRANALLQVNATQLFAHEKGLRFSVTSIDPKCGIVYDPSDQFSSIYMNALFEHGAERGQKGTLWTDS